MKGFVFRQPGLAVMLSSALILLSAGALQAGETSSSAPPSAREEKADLTALFARCFAGEPGDQDWRARKQALIDYSMAGEAATNVPLREYREGMSAEAKTAAVVKAGMVFHLLRKSAGDERFRAAEKEFSAQAKTKALGWDELRMIFEKETAADLTGFFRQWVDGKGLPDIHIEKPSARRRGGGYEATFVAVISGAPYELDLPVEVMQAGGVVKKESIRISGNRKEVAVSLDREPRSLVVDGDYDVPRELSPEEVPPLIGSVARAEKLILVFPPSVREQYQPVIDAFLKRGAVEREAKDLKEADFASSTFIILGADNPVAARLYGTVDVPSAGFVLTAKKNPWNRRLSAAIVQARSAGESAEALADALGMGDWSSVAFDRGRLAGRTKDDSERGMTAELRQDASALNLSALTTLPDIVAAAADKRIVYVGEYHDRFANHDVELEAIRELHRKWPKLVVGMEMFQRPFQKALDDYIAGKIDEREFLKRSQYFKRWGFDYGLYKPLLDYCHAEKIPVVALNTRNEITDKVSKDGMDALTEEERKELPREMDFSDEQYRKRLREIFEEHGSSPERRFDRFYQAQIIWDESMARSIDEYLRERPDYRMVVLAGGGHLAYGSGVPKRAFRRNGLAYSVILNDADAERGIADFAVYPAPLEGVTAPRLMVQLKDEGGTSTITGFLPRSPAEAAGLKAGDVIVSADGEQVKDTGDLKLVLYYKKSGDTLVVKAVRKRFLLGPREMIFEVKL